ncbi:hypothetical protein U9M48_001213 [Paspalum notatum var. saurae]|uniref:Uncharacterized protein n=1 Tax=Paspalum notatum var. saurae TaxID=547442 RepID=A0AAQ3SF09_PASNO
MHSARTPGSPSQARGSPQFHLAPPPREVSEGEGGGKEQESRELEKRRRTPTPSQGRGDAAPSEPDAVRAEEEDDRQEHRRLRRRRRAVAVPLHPLPRDAYDGKEEVIQAWYMDDSEEDQRLPHHRKPKEFIPLDKLSGPEKLSVDPDEYDEFDYAGDLEQTALPRSPFRHFPASKPIDTQNAAAVLIMFMLALIT